jgi:hypothetical protein
MRGFWPGTAQSEGIAEMLISKRRVQPVELRVMAKQVVFMLAPVGGYGNVRAGLSAFDDTGKSQAFVDKINEELFRLPPGMLKADAIASAMTVLTRYGFGAPGSSGLFDDPRPPEQAPKGSALRQAMARRTARPAARR